MPAPIGAGGSGPLGHSESSVRVMGVAYESSTPPLVFERAAAVDAAADAAVEAVEAGDEQGARERHAWLERDFLADEGLALYYAGDFCSKRNPGFEAACLSGCDVAEHLAKRLSVSSVGM